MAKRPKRRKPFREPVPGELEQNAESWSGLKVGLACGGILVVFVLGWLAWQNIYAAGAAGAVIIFLAWIAQMILDGYFAGEREE